MKQFSIGAIILLGLLLGLSIVHARELRVAIFDTGFCIDQLPRHRAIRIKPIIDHAGDFSKARHCQKMDRKNRHLHGHWVLKNFIENYRGKQKVVLTPHIIFNRHGQQFWQYWHKALQSKIDILILAVGFPISKTNSTPLPAITFAASGGWGGAVKAGQKFWPMDLNDKKLILIGGDLENELGLAPLYDKKLLYQNKISYYFSGGNSKTPLRGSSRAVGIAAGRALGLCFELKSLQQCLHKKRKKYPFYLRKRPAYSF